MFMALLRDVSRLDTAEPTQVICAEVNVFFELFVAANAVPATVKASNVPVIAIVFLYIFLS